MKNIPKERKKNTKVKIYLKNFERKYIWGNFLKIKKKKCSQKICKIFFRIKFSKNMFLIKNL